MLLLFATIGLISVAGCKQEPEPDAAPDPVAPASLPQRTPGLWTQTMVMDGSDALQSVKVCLDAVTDRKLAWWSPPESVNCSKNKVERQADGSWTFESACVIDGGGQVNTQGRAVGDFQRSYQVTADTDVRGAAQDSLNGSHTATIDAIREGDCPKGMKPGELELPDGRRINLSAPAPAG
jgi:hypothetical protein